jgi:hypothetical protein
MKRKLLIPGRKILRRIFEPTKDRDDTVYGELERMMN